MSLRNAYLSHFRGRVNIPLNTRQNGAVVSQKHAVVPSTATSQSSGLSPDSIDGPHGWLRKATICARGVYHSYCGGRPSSVRSVRGCRSIVVVSRFRTERRRMSPKSVPETAGEGKWLRSGSGSS